MRNEQAVERLRELVAEIEAGRVDVLGMVTNQDVDMRAFPGKVFMESHQTGRITFSIDYSVKEVADQFGEWLKAGYGT